MRSILATTETVLLLILEHDYIQFGIFAQLVERIKPIDLSGGSRQSLPGVLRQRLIKLHILPPSPPPCDPLISP